MVGNPYEMAWYRSDRIKGEKIYRILHGGVINSDSLKGNNESRFHPTQKPIQLLERILLEFTDEGDVVLDPYLGSGSTAIACKKLGRNFIGIEISSKYCRIAEDRLRQDILL